MYQRIETDLSTNLTTSSNMYTCTQGRGSRKAGPRAATFAHVHLCPTFEHLAQLHVELEVHKGGWVDRRSATKMQFLQIAASIPLCRACAKRVSYTRGACKTWDVHVLSMSCDPVSEGFCWERSCGCARVHV